MVQGLDLGSKQPLDHDFDPGLKWINICAKSHYSALDPYEFVKKHNNLMF